MDQALLAQLASRVRQGRSQHGDLVGELTTALRDLITSGKLPAGSQLAGEITLSEQLNVSRATLREAVRVLVHEKYLVGRRGIGTFVATAPGQRMLGELGQVDAIRSLSDLIHSMGATPGVRGMRIEQVPATAEVAAALQIETQTPVARITRTRLMDQRPVAWASEFVALRSESSFPRLQRFDGTALYRFLRVDMGHTLAHGNLAITAVAASRAIAAELGIAPGDPLLLMRDLVFGEDDRPLVFAVNYHNSAVAEFRLRRTGLAP